MRMKMRMKMRSIMVIVSYPVSPVFPLFFFVHVES
jgi:hypothetical protein